MLLRTTQNYSVLQNTTRCYSVLQKYYTVPFRPGKTIWWVSGNPIFSRKTFRRRVLQKIVGGSHTTHIPHISITPHISHTYPFQTYPINTYPTNTYPFNTYPTNTYPCDAYPFNAYPCKRFASAGMAMYVNAKHILACHCISRNGNVCECKTYPCISLISRNGNEYEYHCMSFHTIATRREW